MIDSKERENRNSLRSEVGKLLLKKLRTFNFVKSSGWANNRTHLGEATGLKNILMSYEKYQSMIVRQYHVQIQGWPVEIPFNVPKIASSSDLRHIRQGLKQGSIRWGKLSRQEIKELDNTYLAHRPETHKRKRASKANLKSAPKAAKKVKSVAYIESSSDEQVSSGRNSA
jgi:hypothetical protein